MVWVEDTLDALKKSGRSLQVAADRGGISRNQVYAWMGRGKKGFSMPTPTKLLEFCDGNNIDATEPFGILGWTLTPETVTPADVPEGDALSELVDIRYNTPDLTPEQEAELDARIRLVVEMYRKGHPGRGEGPGRARPAV